jgi:rubrerythrin
MYAVTGETGAHAKYRAFADVAEKEGHKEIAAIFRAIADAELQHAKHEFEIAQKIGKVEMPKAEKITTGTTKENLQMAIDGEVEEYTKMYPEFVNIAEKEHMVDARLIFILAKLAEEVHAGIYADILKNIDNFDKEKYAELFRCPECGNIILNTRPEYCPICAEPGKELISYKIVGLAPKV